MKHIVLIGTIALITMLWPGYSAAQTQHDKAAKGNRSWDEYRRALLTELAQCVFIGPAKQVNPDITMIVKYPQWYDRFHLFGYDTKTLPELFDKVWVGTETRGRNTQRFGFVQPYEVFVNYHWLADIAGEKIGGAWFDHGDCAEHDFINQAYTSVLAGDMYIMDFLGMLGIPIVPVHKFPINDNHDYSKVPLKKNRNIFFSHCPKKHRKRLQFQSRFGNIRHHKVHEPSQRMYMGNLDEDNQRKRKK